MHIVQIVPGSGGTFYCQNCLRDLALVQELRRQGHTVTLLPLYLPLVDEAQKAIESAPVFYGAINCFLAQIAPFFRRARAWFDRFLDARPLLRTAARFGSSTRAAGLEDMTLSMLRGAQGHQAKELDRLLAWLKTQERPTVVQLSNPLLLGLAPRLRAELEVPICCSLQDEDTWVDTMAAEGAQQVWNLMAEQSAAVDAFVAVSRTYGAAMAARLGLQPEAIRVIYPGIDLQGYETSSLPANPPVLGFLSRLNDDLGLGDLVEAFLRLRAQPEWHNLQLRATGGQVGEDAACLRRIARRVAAAGAARDVRITPSFARDERIAFLRELTLLSVPVRNGEAFGLFTLEALAAGVPVVLPAVGAFPEILEATGGGRLCPPGSVTELATALDALLRDRTALEALGRTGRARVHESFSIAETARKHLALYRECGAEATHHD